MPTQPPFDAVPILKYATDAYNDLMEVWYGQRPESYAENPPPSPALNTHLTAQPRAVHTSFAARIVAQDRAHAREAAEREKRLVQIEMESRERARVAAVRRVQEMEKGKVTAV